MSDSRVGIEDKGPGDDTLVVNRPGRERRSFAFSKLRHNGIGKTSSRRNRRSVTGNGVTGDVDGPHAALGDAKLMDDAGIKDADLAKKADELCADGATALFLALDGKAAGIIAIVDPIKATSAAALQRLQTDG